jgi:outer membrane lipoprotein-sorting protein
MRIAILLSLALTAPLHADDAAMAVVKKALAASGYDKVTATAMTWHDKGVVHLPGAKLDYEADWVVARPDKYRFRAAAKFNGADVVITAVFDGDKAWESDGKASRDITGDKLAQMKQEMHQFNVLALQPLTADKNYMLKGVGESVVDMVKCSGVSVSRTGFAPITLYFDAGTGLLFKMESTAKDEFQNWKDVKEEAWFSDYKDAGGRKLFGKMKTHRDGKLHIESEFSDVKDPDKIDPKVFEKP